MNIAENFNGIKGLAFIARNGVKVELQDEHVFLVYGFYKSFTVEVNLETRKIHARYDEVTDLDEWDDLVHQLIMLNHKWQERSAWRCESWNQMDPAWVAVEAAYQKLEKAA